MVKGLSPTQRTLRELRDQGRLCGIVERFNTFAGPHGVRQDLFGFIDIIALDVERGIIGIQSCGQSFSAHRKKIVEERNQEAFEWLRCGGKIELWGWRKVKLKRGGIAVRWKPRIEEITLESLGNGVQRRALANVDRMIRLILERETKRSANSDEGDDVA